MKLYTYFRSSAAYRVRIALNLKGLQAEMLPVHLVNNGGEQFGEVYSALNPQHLVPLLDDDGVMLSQSLAIIEYLDETRSPVPLLPADPAGRARVRSLSQSIACEIHPINNLRVLKYLSERLGVTSEQKNRWYQHWVSQGLQALEKEIAQSPHTRDFCHGDTPTMADCCLVPQLYNARRFECDVTAYPTLVAIAERCQALGPFADAHPDAQADA